jgi:phospholipid/cholesterol/gamma-HCH transport system substrate-binding protein
MSLRRTAIKLAAFVVGTALLGSVVVGTLAGESLGKTDTYHAIFGDVSGLRTGDPVRVTGVVVGKVTGEKLVDASHVKVTFSVNRKQHLSTTTYAVVRYANLLGQRFLALTQDAKPGQPLRHGATIPQERTAPALSLTALFNGFRPLFQSLDTKQINELSGEIVQILQGESGVIDDLLAQVASLTTDLANRDELIGGVIDSLSKLLHTVAKHDTELESMVDSLTHLTANLAAATPTIRNSLSSVDDLMQSVAGLLSGLDEHGLTNQAIDLDALTKVVAQHQDVLDATVKGFPDAFGHFDRISQNGNWINAYACSAISKIVGTPYITPQQISILIADGLGNNALASTIQLLLGGLLPSGVHVSVPFRIPEGKVGNQSAHSAVCR